MSIINNNLIVRNIDDIIDKYEYLSQFKRLIIKNNIDLKIISKCLFSELEELNVETTCTNLGMLSLKNFPKLNIIKIHNNTEFISFDSVYYNNNIK